MDARAIYRTMFSPDAGQALAELPAFVPAWQSQRFHHVGMGASGAAPAVTTALQTTIQSSPVNAPAASFSITDQPQISPPRQGQPPPEGEAPHATEAPRSDAGAGGTSTTTMLLLGGAAFVAVMLLLKKRGK